MDDRTLSIKVTWEGYMGEMLRILLNPHATLNPEGVQTTVGTMLKIARMADKYVELMEEE